MYFHDICGAKLENIDKLDECPECLCPLNKENISTIPDGGWVKAVSTDENFMKAMTELYENNPIEYQLKISQFKANLKQQESSKKVEEDNKVRCPNCHSTNVKAITGTEQAMSIMGLGIFSKKINKSFKCLNCKYTW